MATAVSRACPMLDLKFGDYVFVLSLFLNDPTSVFQQRVRLLLDSHKVVEFGLLSASESATCPDKREDPGGESRKKNGAAGQRTKSKKEKSRKSVKTKAVIEAPYVELEPEPIALYNDDDLDIPSLSDLGIGTERKRLLRRGKLDAANQIENPGYDDSIEMNDLITPQEDDLMTETNILVADPSKDDNLTSLTITHL